MHNFKYDIKLNDKGRPYIELPDEYDNPVEDRYMAFELTRYILFEMIEKQKEMLNSGKLNDIEYLNSENLINKLFYTGNVISELSDKIGMIVINQNNTLDDANDILNSNN